MIAAVPIIILPILFLFLFLPPTLTGISPVSGRASGGTAVTLTGTGFINVQSVLFGTKPAKSFSVVDYHTITAVSPAGQAGKVQVTVTTTFGVSGGVTYTYLPPVITGISPSVGPVPGGTTVTLTGTRFSDATAVLFGTASASFTVQSDTSITTTSPAGRPGSVPVVVVTPYGSSNGAIYRYNPRAPYISQVVFIWGGPDQITAGFTGSGFTGATSMKFGPLSASFHVSDDGYIEGTVPHTFSGNAPIVVTTPEGTSNSYPFYMW